MMNTNTNNKMFCFQCEQTAGGTGCMGSAGVCGKSDGVAKLQDELTGALIGFARAAENNEYRITEKMRRTLLAGLFTTVTNVNFDAETVMNVTNEVHKQKAELFGSCLECGAVHNSDDFNMDELWKENEDIRSLKSLILFGIRGMAAYAYNAAVLGYQKEDINNFFLKALRVVGKNSVSAENLFDVVLEVGEYNLKCMELLDRANTETFGVPEPVEVSRVIEAGPFIVVSGHDLLDLKMLLEQTDGTGVSVYTHGEMLPAHGYPELRRYKHLKGHFGTAWQNQREEFDGIPGAVLFTTNCLMPPRESYKDRVFTTEVVSYPDLVHIGEYGIAGRRRNFAPVIEKAVELGGYDEDILFTGINGGTSLTTGHSWRSILKHSHKLEKAVKKGEISQFFLVGGCDGAKPGRNYYTDFVMDTPEDSIVLTLACGKFRFNDLELGKVAGLPRLMDLGQCNDSYGAIKVALALAEKFDCNVNELPLTIMLSWYEQKAVCVLLTLLYLGITNINLGPSMPAFISPNVGLILAEEYGLTTV